MNRLIAALFLGSAAAFAPAATQARTSALSAYVPQGLSEAEYKARKAADANKKQANKSRFPQGKNLVKDVADWLVEMEAKQTFKGDQVAGSGHTYAKEKFNTKTAFDVATKDGARYEADAVVNCCGLWSQTLSAELGLE